MATANGSFAKSELPKFDVNAVVAMQKANLETFVQAQKIWTDAAQSIAKLQVGYVNDLVSQAQAMFAAREPRGADNYVADARAAAEKAVTVAKQQIDLGAKAQAEMVDLVAKRVTANFEQAKSLAA